MTADIPATDAPLARRTPGESGIWVFLLGDMLVFGVFFATFMTKRAEEADVFDVSRKALHLGVGLTNTFVLLTSSLCVVVALAAMQSTNMRVARTALLMAALCGGIFIALKLFEYRSLVLAGHSFLANNFFLYYFALTGIHLFHVCVGVGVVAIMLTQTRLHALSHMRMSMVEGGACFWHLVDLLWIVLFPLLYLVG